MSHSRWPDEEQPRRRRTGRDRNLNGPVPVGDVLKGVAARIGLEQPDALTTIFGRWTTLVGASVAAHVKPLRLQDRTLVVAADHPAWATQLRHLAPQLLERLREQCPPGEAPERLEVRVRA